MILIIINSYPVPLLCLIACCGLDRLKVAVVMKPTQRFRAIKLKTIS